MYIFPLFDLYYFTFKHTKPLYLVRTSLHNMQSARNAGYWRGKKRHYYICTCQDYQLSKEVAQAVTRGKKQKQGKPAGIQARLKILCILLEQDYRFAPPFLLK